MQAKSEPPRALLIGHVSKDLTPLGSMLGGTVSFAGLTLQALGCRVRVLTSAASDLDLSPLDGIELECVPAAASTSFENRYFAERREQWVRGCARPLHGRHVPEAWRRCDLLILGPIANEIGGDLPASLDFAFLGVTAQGWLRRVDSNGKVQRLAWRDLERRLPREAAVVLSAEDLGGEIEAGNLISNWCRALAITCGAGGAHIFWQGQHEHLPAPHAVELDPTGAGDIFAATYFYRLYMGDDPPLAARWANRIASASVERQELMGVPTKEEIHASGVLVP
ncbi:MAG: PfkB family carbohydrate kinase [Anaerolineales bacterium]